MRRPAAEKAKELAVQQHAVPRAASSPRGRGIEEPARVDVVWRDEGACMHADGHLRKGRYARIAHAHGQVPFDRRRDAVGEHVAGRIEPTITLAMGVGIAYTWLFRDRRTLSMA